MDRVYTMDTYSQKTEDGGLTWENTGENSKHIDNHALWIDPDNPDHLLNGNDGGVYESYDQAETWRFFPNLPITQFYKVTVDSAKPFYNVLGGTQDNYSHRGPSRTTSSNGITNADWYITRGGDGFESAADPENPNIIYAQSQYGNLVRFDMETKSSVSIQPQPREGEKELTYNWDAPLVISPRSGHPLLCGRQGLPQHRPRQQLEGHLGRSHPPDRPQPPGGYGTGLAHGRRGQELLHLRVRQHCGHGRIARAVRRDLRRHRRRPGACNQGRRGELDRIRLLSHRAGTYLRERPGNLPPRGGHGLRRI
ncbi:MAG: hypothetical protein U5K31_09480 [Balneolaceae bacterium]|nr:hypothetical protein [Balneolaceae bacterium]